MVSWPMICVQVGETGYKYVYRWERLVIIVQRVMGEGEPTKGSLPHRYEGMRHERGHLFNVHAVFGHATP